MTTAPEKNGLQYSNYCNAQWNMFGCFGMNRKTGEKK